MKTEKHYIKYPQLQSNIYKKKISNRIKPPGKSRREVSSEFLPSLSGNKSGVSKEVYSLLMLDAVQIRSQHERRRPIRSNRPQNKMHSTLRCPVLGLGKNPRSNPTNRLASVSPGRCPAFLPVDFFFPAHVRSRDGSNHLPRLRWPTPLALGLPTLLRLGKGVLVAVVDIRHLSS